jgi:transcriptional regulator GlxA family with amidase domain
VSARIAGTLEVVAARGTTPLTVAALAGEARLSEGRFAHVFRAEIGLSPRQLVRRARVELAREMIVHERRRHHEVARALGFVDGSHLAKVFLAETGRRLSECRQG